MIGQLRSTVVDCRDPMRLATFYAGVLGGSLHEEDEPPRFPDPRGSQQFHLDIRVDEVDAAEKAVLGLGATRVTDAIGEDRFRVYRDPAGHTFCLVWGTAD